MSSRLQLTIAIPQMKGAFFTPVRLLNGLIFRDGVVGTGILALYEAEQLTPSAAL
jgi:hypothetical protein